MKRRIVLVGPNAPVSVFSIPAGNEAVICSDGINRIKPCGAWRIHVDVIFEYFLTEHVILLRRVIKCIGGGTKCGLAFFQFFHIPGKIRWRTWSKLARAIENHRLTFTGEWEHWLFSVPMSRLLGHF